jgi:hypothetical protein
LRQLTEAHLALAQVERAVERVVADRVLAVLVLGQIEHRLAPAAPVVERDLDARDALAAARVGVAAELVRAHGARPGDGECLVVVGRKGGGVDVEVVDDVLGGV